MTGILLLLEIGKDGILSNPFLAIPYHVLFICTSKALYQAFSAMFKPQGSESYTNLLRNTGSMNKNYPLNEILKNKIWNYLAIADKKRIKKEGIKVERQKRDKSYIGWLEERATALTAYPHFHTINHWHSIYGSSFKQVICWQILYTWNVFQCKFTLKLCSCWLENILKMKILKSMNNE